MDSKGTIWFGTHDGLSRFDGHHFKNFKVDNQDSVGLQGSVLMNIKEGIDNIYWIACNGMGLIKFDAKAETFKSFKHAPNDENSISADATTTIFIDEEQRIWVGTFTGGLNLFDPKTEKFKRYEMDETFSPGESFMKNSVSHIIADPLDKNKLWLATHEGIRHFDKTTGAIIKYPIMESYPTFSVTLLADEEGMIWIGTEGHGLVQFNSKTKQVDYLSEPMQAKSVVRKSENELWVSTISKGLGIYNLKNKTWEFLTDSDSKSYAILSNDIYGLYIDNEDRLWVRDMTQGVSIAKKFGTLFSKPSMTPEVEQSLLGHKKFTFLPDSNELLVAPTLGNRIFIFKKESQGYFQNKTFNLPLNVENETRIFDIFTTSNNRTFALAKESENIALFQYQNNDFVEVPIKELKSIKANEESEGTLQEDNKGRLWISFSSGKLLGWDGAEDVQQYKIGKNLNSDMGPQIYDIVFDDQNNMWAASLADGICRLDLEKNEEVNFSYEAGWFEGWRTHAVAILKNGLVWMGTSASGIYELDPNSLSKKDVVRYNQTNGSLPDEKINGIKVSESGNVWIATARGLLKYNPESHHFIQYGKENGLINTFLDKGFELLSNGDIVIGQPQGFLTLSPSQFLDTPTPQEVQFSLMSVNGEPFPTEEHLNFMERVELEQEQNYFTIQFSAQYFDEVKKIKYRYILENYDRDWTTISNGQAEANYTNVPAGNYTLKVLAANQEGVWNTQPSTLDLIIKPYWYWSDWMKMIYGIILLGVLTIAWRMQKKRWVLQSQLQLEKSEASRLKDLDGMKSRFFTNVSHELRTPITLMLGPISSILKSEELSNKQFTLLKVAQQNGKDLLKLIGSILDLSKMESGKLNLVNQSVEFFPFIRRLVTNFESHAERLNIDFSFVYNTQKALKVEMDISKIEIIINNLISNALKFTPKNGAVAVTIDDLENNLQLTIQDTGRGIHPEDLPHIFDRFYQSRKDTRTEGGTGIGLAVSQEYVKLMGGKIWVESELGKGSTFKVQIPRKEILTGATSSLENMDSTSIEVERKQNLKPILVETQTDKKFTVMIVEDNYSLRDYLQLILAPYFNTIIAENGQVALDQLNDIFSKKENEGRMPDLILSDVMMPVMDGYELLKTLRSSDDFRHLPVVMLTARADTQDRLEALRIGVDDYLLKPFDEEELLARIQNLLRNYSQRMSSLLESNITNGQDESDVSLAKKEKPMTEQDQVWLERLEKTILEYLSDAQFNMDFLGFKMECSRRQLQRRIKKLVGLTPKEYINEIRLHEARKLLETGKSQSIKTTAFQVGYADPKYFSAQFKERFGKIPSSYLE